MILRNAMQSKIIRVPIYDHIIELIVFKKWTDVWQTKYWNTIKKDYGYRELGGLTIPFENISKTALFIPQGKLRVLVHELIHVKNYICKRKVMTLDNESEAYLMDYMFDKCSQYVNGKFNHR